MFISFEGLDGSGKTTQIERLHARLDAAGRRVVRVREPGGTPTSEAIRALLLDPALAVDPRAELLLFSAARAQLCEAVIRPALEAGAVVLADRFFDSTTAYQGGGRGVAPEDWLEAAFHPFVTGRLAPDRTYLFRLDPAAAAARRADRDADRMEAAGLAFFRRVDEAYDRLAARHPERVVVLDAAADRDGLERRIWADLAPRLVGETAPPPSR